MSRASFITVGVALLAGAVFGFLRPRTAQTPLELAQQISSADRVVLINSTASFDFEGSEAQKLVRAVSQSKEVKMRAGNVTECIAGHYLDFYLQTNFLVRIEGHDDHFHVSNGSYYEDKSGALQAAWYTLHVRGRR